MVGYILGTTLGSIAILVALVFLIIYYVKQLKHYKKIKEIGTKAEVKINSDLRAWARQTKNLFLDSSLFKYNENKVFEVDSILVTSKALIVVEIKSIKGKIVGSANELHWKKILGENQFEFKSPIFQNERHIEHIIKMTGAKVPTLSLIVFSNRSASLSVSNQPGHVIVTRHADLFNVLDKIDASLPPVMNDFEIRNLYNSIKKHSTKKLKDKMLHDKITRGVSWK